MSNAILYNYRILCNNICNYRILCLVCFESVILGSAMQAAEQMHPKDCIKNYFPQRKCFVLPIPVKNTELMDQIDTLDDCDFSENFLKVVHAFCEYIFSQSKVKTIFNEITTGRGRKSFLTLIL